MCVQIMVLERIFRILGEGEIRSFDIALLMGLKVATLECNEITKKKRFYFKFILINMKFI